MHYINFYGFTTTSELEEALNGRTIVAETKDSITLDNGKVFSVTPFDERETDLVFKTGLVGSVITDVRVSITERSPDEYECHDEWCEDDCECYERVDELSGGVKVEITCLGFTLMGADAYVGGYYGTTISVVLA